MFARAVLFVFLVLMSSPSPPPPMGGPGVLRVCQRVVGFFIGFGAI
jgi:hypothetical protein